MNVSLLIYSTPAGVAINQSQHSTVYSIALIFETRHRLSPVAVRGRGRQQLWRDQDPQVWAQVYQGFSDPGIIIQQGQKRAYIQPSHTSTVHQGYVVWY